MAVNRNKEHLVVFLEDKPYKDIINGVINVLNTNERCIDIKKPCGGWLKVFTQLENNLFLLNNDKCNILLLIDFDDTIKGRVRNRYFESRMQMLINKVPSKYKDKVFLLGANYQASEDLKKGLVSKHLNFEEVGELLVKDCPNGHLTHWQNIYLKCNLPEIERMRKNGIFDWLFK